MYASSFLQAIREDPADDVPRLVFADWLEDEGQFDRAEFAECVVFACRRHSPLPGLRRRRACGQGVQRPCRGGSGHRPTKRSARHGCRGSQWSS